MLRRLAPAKHDRITRLESLIAEIEDRARSTEAYADFHRSEFPGTKAVLKEFVERHRPDIAKELPDNIERFDDCLKQVGVKFKQGRNTHKGKKFFRTLYPDCTDWE